MEQNSLDKILEALPEIQAGKNLWQNEFHEFDVYNHTLSFVKHAKGLTEDPNIIAAAYLHDIGKPVVAKPKYEKGVLQERKTGKPYHKFDDHEKIGKEMVKKMNPGLFKELELDQNRIANLVGCHYTPMEGIKKMRKAKTFDEFANEYQKLENTLSNALVSKEDIMTMFLADKLAQGGPEFATDREELFMIRGILLKQGEKTLKDVFQIMQEKYYKK